MRTSTFSFFLHRFLNWNLRLAFRQAHYTPKAPPAGESSRIALWTMRPTPRARPASFFVAFVGARYIVPGKHAWRCLGHPPRSRGGVIPPALTQEGSGASRAFAFARSAGTQGRAPGSTVSRAREICRGISLRSPMCLVAASSRRRSFIRRGTTHAVPGAHAWLPVRHPLAYAAPPCGVRELAPAVCRPGLPGRAPRINLGTPISRLAPLLPRACLPCLP